jgi:hypothetical protein
MFRGSDIKNIHVCAPVKALSIEAVAETIGNRGAAVYIIFRSRLVKGGKFFFGVS